MSLQQKLNETKHYLSQKIPGRTIQGAIVLGSGLGLFADTLKNPVAIDYKEIPHFHPSTVPGHAGRLVIGEAASGLTVACMQGRFHYYEGHDMETVVFPIRVFRQLGADFMIVTNAAGGINTDFKAGSLMLIDDHINMVGTNPLRGSNLDALGPRFPDMSEAYDKALIKIAQKVADEQGTSLERGVYMGLSGPCYETPAEVRMLRLLGADAVGMSTVPEVIVANHMAMKVLGISCITNPAAGLSEHKLSHQEVMEMAEQAKPRFVRLLQGVLDAVALERAGVATPASSL